jgi:3-phosphoinositide dependent protein kinase-1
MEALRSHPFFASIRWETLWDDPAPPLETGLVRREPAPVDEWDDVGAAWDELVSGPDGSEDEDEDDASVEGSHPHGNAHAYARSRAPGDDGIEWAPDEQAYVSPPAIPPEEIGPHGEMPDYARGSLSLAGAVNGTHAVDAVVASGSVDDGRGEIAVGAGADSAVNGGYGMRFVPPGIDGVLMNAITNVGEGAVPGIGPDPGPGLIPGPGPGKNNVAERGRPVSSSTEANGDGELATGDLTRRKSTPLRVPRGMRDSYATSSSDGSPVEKLGAALEAIGIHRGRLRTRSPTPARGSPSSAEAPDWYVSYFPIFHNCCARVLNGIEIPPYRSSVLNVGEAMQFHAPVEETALKRRTSRLLLPLPVSQRKPKVRELALTSHRLVSLKPLKSGRGVGIKAEFVVREFQGQLAVGSSGREKRSKGDEVRRMVTGVERKGTKEFVVLTVSLFPTVLLPLSGVVDFDWSLPMSGRLGV